MNSFRATALTSLAGKRRLPATAGLLVLAVLAVLWPHLVGSSALFFWETTVISVLFATSVTLLFGIAVAGVLAFVTSVITWRATGLAFAMLTLAIAQAIYTLVVQVNSL